MPSISFYVNGKAITVQNPDPVQNLAYYVRNTLRLTGTKLACEEGACGACTVVVGRWDIQKKKPVYYAMNACLVPLYMVDRCSVITVEGISKERIHPIQERLSRGHGSQCGFCSPGFTMSLYALLRNNPKPSMEEINQAVKGNLCRCTGYRPILEAFYSFSDEALVGCCRGSGGGCPCKDGNANKLVTFEEMTPYDPTSEIIFPPKLIMDVAVPLESQIFNGSRVTVYCPTSLVDLQSYSKIADTYKIVSSGMISRLISGMSQDNGKQNWISVHRIPELSEITKTNDILKIGAALSITVLALALEDHLKYSASIIDLFKKYSAEQVKSVASWAGAIASASATSDVCAVAYALNLQVNVLNLERTVTRKLNIDELFKGHKTSLSPQDVILSIEFPCHLENVNVYTYKQGERRGGDSTIVNMAAKMTIASGIIKTSRIVLGVDRKHTLANALSNALENRKVSEILPEFDQLAKSLEVDLEKHNNIRDFSFKKALCRAAIFNMFNKMSGSSTYNALEINPNQFESSQVFKVIDRQQSPADDCGRPLAHQYAGRHTTGEARYINDLKYDGMLHLAPVISTEAHADILSVDMSAALELPGVVDYIDVKDIPKGGQNRPASDHRVLTDDTPVFAEGKVEAIGQIIGAIIAEDVLTARRAAKLVKVEYKKLKPILTIEDAIEAKSYLVDPQTFGGKSEEEISKALSNCENVVEGEFFMGAQEHLYLETQASVVIPGEEDEYVIQTSTQGVAAAQELSALVLGIPSGKIVVKVKRVGGAFGGKATQCIFARHVALVAAAKLKRPISSVFCRTDDMLITGKRHPVKGIYKVGFDKSGRLHAVHFKLYVDGGFTCDSSPFVTMVVGMVSTSSFYVPNVRAEAYAMKTHKNSNTAFRGFGQPQTSFIMESVINHVAYLVGKPCEEIKELNFGRVGDLHLTGSIIQNDGMIECWEECKKFSQLDKLQKEVAEFNKTSHFIKRGLAMSSTRFGLPHAGPFEQGAALVQICSDGSVSVSIGGVEMGQGLNIKVLQCASRALNIPVEKIHMLDVGTDKTINAPMTGGSQGADIHGKAVKKSCEKLMAGLRPYLEKYNGEWKEAVFQAYNDKVPLQSSEHIYIERKKYNLGEHDAAYFTTGAACVLAEVDCLSGEQRLISVDIVMDVGESLNPAIDIGQIEGGFMQGYGLFTTEAVEYDCKGKLLQDTAYKYKVPTVQMVPDKFRVKLIGGISNYPDQINSSKGIGEPPLMLGTAAHSAIRKAIMSYRDENGKTEYQILNSPLTAKYIYSKANE